MAMKDIAAGFAYSDLLTAKGLTFEAAAKYRVQVRSAPGPNSTLYATLKSVTGAQPGITYVDDKTLRLTMSAAQTAPMVKSVSLDIVREDTNPDEYLGGQQTIKVVVPTTAPEAEAGTGTNPLITSESPSGSYPEGQAIGGLLEADRTVTWAKSGVDAYAVTLNPATGAWTLEETDFITKKSYAFTFTATDLAGRTAQQTVAIAITDVVEVTPAPVFTTQPSISPGSGTAGTTSFTATNGTASNATSYSRRWLLNGASIGTGTIVLPQSAGSLVLEVTATGPGGGTVATSAAVTVGAAAPTIQLTLTGPLALAAGAPAGTTVFYIGNVPAGSTPTIAPSDGRLAVAGNTTDGWRGVVGMTASTVGNIALTVSASGAEAASATVRVVSPVTHNVNGTNRVGIATDPVSLASTNTARREHYVSPQGAITNMQPVFLWAYYTSDGKIQNAATAAFEHSIEYPEGVIHPVTWDGAVSVNTVGGTTYKADVVLDSRTGQPLRMPAGARFWERTCYISTSTRAFPAQTHVASVSALGLSDGKLAGNQVPSGTIPADTTSTISWGMAALMCTIEAPEARSIVSVGDSMCVGQGDATGTGANKSSGMVARAIDPLFPHVKLARGGIYAQQHATILAGVGVPNFLSQIGASHVVVQAGLNDLSLGSRTAAQVMADRQSIIDVVAARIPGIVPVHTTITPRVNSASGNYSSVADQTPKTDGNMADLTPLNTLIRQQPLVMDFADAAMSARDSNVNSGPFPFGTDGTHYNSAKCAAIAAAVNKPFGEALDPIPTEPEPEPEPQPADLTPDAFSFSGRSNADRETAYESNEITVAGLSAGASPAVSIVGGSYSKNGGAYTTGNGTAQNGDTFKVRVTSSANYSATTGATLTIGGVDGSFAVTTRAEATAVLAYTDWNGPARWDFTDASTLTLSGDKITSAASKYAAPDPLTAGGKAGAWAHAPNVINGVSAALLTRDVATTTELPRLASAGPGTPSSLLFQGNDKPFLAAVVYAPVDANSGYIWAASGASGNQIGFLRRTTNSAARKWTYNPTNTPSPDVSIDGHAANTWHIVIFRHDGTTTTVYDNSRTPKAGPVAHDMQATQTDLIFRLGAANTTGSNFGNTQCSAYIAEMVLSPGQSDAEVQKFLTDMSAKFALPLA